MKTLRSLLTIFIFVFASQTRAELDFEDHAFPEFITSARALAMGNAYICKVDDAWSAFYNPAGLGTVRKPQFHIGNLHLEVSSGLSHAIGEGPASNIPSQFMRSFDPEELKGILSETKGELAHARANFFPNFTVRGLTLGYLISQRNRSIIEDDGTDTFELLERRDHGPVMSLSGSLFGGIIKFGATGVYLIRRDLDLDFGPTDPVTVQTSDYQSGKSLQITAGTKVTLPVALLPAFSAVLRNATANDWEDVSNNGGPDKIKQTVDLGFSITPQVGKISRVHLEANLKDANNSYDTDIKRRLAAGMEFDIHRRLFIRAGWGDGWGSGGLGVRTRTFILDLTTYAIDRSLDGFREDEDRRWVLGLSSGF